MKRKTILFLLCFLFGSLSVLMLMSFKTKEAPDQALFVGISLICFVVIQHIPQAYIRRFVPLMAGITVFLLGITLILGRASHGAVRWLPFGPVHVQVSEFAKPVIALTLAWFVCRYPLKNHRRIAAFVCLTALFFLPVFLQPDLGSALVLGAISLVCLFFAVRRLVLLIPWGVCFLIVIGLTYAFVLKPYQKDRMVAFLHGGGSAAYNAEQAYITVGSGKMLGRGLGHGVQTQLRFLPEYHTDFFFASLGEELGFVGVSGIFFLYGSLYVVLFWKKQGSNAFGSFVLVAMTGGIFFQMAVHMGMNMKLFPIAGIPLPLLSSGGSSFLSTCLGLAVACRVTDRHV